MDEDAEPFNYERQQFDRLLAAHPPPDGVFHLKVMAPGASATTKWLAISRSQVERIADILCEE